MSVADSLPLKYRFGPALRPSPRRNSNEACLWNHTCPSNNSTCVFFMHYHLLTQQHPTVKGLSVFTTAGQSLKSASSHCCCCGPLEGAVNLDNTAPLTSKATGVKPNTAWQVFKQLHTWCHSSLDACISRLEPVLGCIHHTSGALTKVIC